MYAISMLCRSIMQPIDTQLQGGVIQVELDQGSFSRVHRTPGQHFLLVVVRKGKLWVPQCFHIAQCPHLVQLGIYAVSHRQDDFLSGTAQATDRLIHPLSPRLCSKIAHSFSPIIS